MLVCLCHGINDKKIREAVDAGADSIRKVQKCTNAGQQCGACLEDIRAMIGGKTCASSESVAQGSSRRPTRQ